MVITKGEICCRGMLAFLSVEDRALSPVFSLAEDRKSNYGYNDRGFCFCPKCGILLTENQVIFIPSNCSEFCCGIIEDLILEKEEHDFFDIFYQSFARRFFFSTSIYWRRNEPKDKIYPEWDFEYCLYCGTKFKESLLSQWLSIARNEFGIGLTIKLEDMLDKLPAEYRTDQWWKSRGL